MGKYIKTRLHWSSGVDPWVLHYVSDDFNQADVNEFISDTNSENSYSEHYRGCEVVFVDLSEVDDRTIRGGILRCERDIERIARKRTELFNTLLCKQIQGIIASRSE